MIVKVKTPLSPCHRPWNLEQKKLKDPWNLHLTMFLISNKPSSVKLLSPIKKVTELPGVCANNPLLCSKNHRSRNECPSTCKCMSQTSQKPVDNHYLQPIPGWFFQPNPSAISGTFIAKPVLKKMFRKSLETVNQWTFFSLTSESQRSVASGFAHVE